MNRCKCIGDMCPEYFTSKKVRSKPASKQIFPTSLALSPFIHACPKGPSNPLSRKPFLKTQYLKCSPPSALTCHFPLVTEPVTSKEF